MTKKELQEKLYNMGASVDLITMPAVIERISKMFECSYPKMTIGVDGEIIIQNVGTFSKTEEMGAKYDCEDFTSKIDSYGMEIEILGKFSDSKTSRKDGKINYFEPENKVYIGGPYEFEYDDNAYPLLDDVFNYATCFQSGLRLQGTYGDNSSYLLANYPRTKGWFEENNLEAAKPQEFNDETLHPSFPIENSIDNRLATYYAQIQEAKETELRIDDKIDILLKYVNYKGSEEIKKDIQDFYDNKIQAMEKILEDIARENKKYEFSLEEEGKSISVVEKGRRTLDYMLKSLELKQSLRNALRKRIVKDFIRSFPNSERNILGKMKIIKDLRNFGTDLKSQPTIEDRNR